MNEILLTDKLELLIQEDPNTNQIIFSDPGIQGPPGLNGIDGIDGDKTYTHTQAIPALFWTVTHNLNKFPSVTIVDSANTSVVGDITYLNQTNLTLRFNSAFSGKAFLN